MFCLQAECWLGALESSMRCTVRKEIQEAVAAYEDKPRDQWLFDYPAQVYSHPKQACTEDYMKGHHVIGT